MGSTDKCCQISSNENHVNFVKVKLNNNCDNVFIILLEIYKQFLPQFDAYSTMMLNLGEKADNDNHITRYIYKKKEEN